MVSCKYNYVCFARCGIILESNIQKFVVVNAHYPFYSLTCVPRYCSVHDDVQVAQWLKTPDQRLKFGDFNRAMILKYDSKGEEYCQYSTGGRGWRVSSF